MAPTETFHVVIFFPKMDNAIKLGYKFKIMKGYTYENKIIFSNYIENLYKIRLLLWQPLDTKSNSYTSE